jgi:endoglucanase
MKQCIKPLLLSVGVLSLGFGILGIFLPLLPTTPFLLLSAFCFMRSSQKFYSWLINHKYLGTYIINFQIHKSIPLRVKIVSISILWITILTTAFFFVPLLSVKILLLAIAIAVSFHIAHYKTLKKPISMFHIHKGINLSHWLSQVFCWSPRETFITSHDIANIKQWGFDHVRLPIDEDQLWDENFKKNAAAFEYLHKCITWCLHENLKIVIDLHILRSHHFNNANNEGAMTLWTDTAEQEHMMDVWRELSAELQHYPTDELAYEFMNEPVAPKPSLWNDLVARGYALLRELEPERFLIFGPNMWQMPQFYKSFALPQNATRVILSYHTYSPLPFTHYKAGWLPLGKYDGAVHYPGKTIPDSEWNEFEQANGNDVLAVIAKERKEFDKQSMIAEIKPALEFAAQRGMQLYCNEFGCLPSVNRTERLLYYSDLSSVFKQFNIAFAAWDFKGDFGIQAWDRKTFENGAIDTELISALLETDN